GVRPGDVVGAIANEAGVPGNAIGAIDIMDRSTFVEVPEADAPRVMDALSRTKLRGRRVYVDIARPRSEFGQDDRPHGDRARSGVGRAGRPGGRGGGGGGAPPGGGGRAGAGGAPRTGRGPPDPPRPRPPYGRRDEPPRRRR